MFENVLVTGGSGFVGWAVLAELASRGCAVTATYTGPPGRLPVRPGVTWLQWAATRELLPAVEWAGLAGVVHLAAPRDLFDFPGQAAAMYETMVASTFRLVE